MTGQPMWSPFVMYVRTCDVTSLQVCLYSNKVTFLPHVLISDETLLSGHLTFPRGWPLNRGSTVHTHNRKSGFFCSIVVNTFSSLWGKIDSTVSSSESQLKSQLSENRYSRSLLAVTVKCYRYLPGLAIFGGCYFRVARYFLWGSLRSKLYGIWKLCYHCLTYSNKCTTSLFLFRLS